MAENPHGEISDSRKLWILINRDYENDIIEKIALLDKLNFKKLFIKKLHFLYLCMYKLYSKTVCIHFWTPG